MDSLTLLHSNFFMISFVDCGLNKINFFNKLLPIHYQSVKLDLDQVLIWDQQQQKSRRQHGQLTGALHMSIHRSPIPKYLHLN